MCLISIAGEKGEADNDNKANRCCNPLRDLDLFYISFIILSRNDLFDGPRWFSFNMVRIFQYQLMMWYVYIKNASQN